MQLVIKGNKKAHSFIAALKQLNLQKPTDRLLQLYFMFSVEEIRIATSLTPNTPNSCHCILKKDIYTLSDHEQTEPRILLIKAFPLNAALFRRQAKITLIELSLNQDRLVLHYEILDGDMDCEVKLECEQVRRPWMEHPRSIDPQANESVTMLMCLTQETFKAIQFDYEEIWMQCFQNKVAFRRMKNGRFIQQRSIKKEKFSDYNYNYLRGKLCGKTFMCFESRIFFKHICYCVKYKRTCRLFVKMLMDSYDETKVKQAFLILETESEWGLLDKTIRCFIGSNVQEINFVAGQRPPQPEFTSIMLKTEERPAILKKMILNRIADIEAEERHCGNLIRETRPIGKIQDGEQTFSRKRTFDF